MSATNPPKFLAILVSSAIFATQWRLLLLWIITLMIPTVVMTVPLWQIIASQLDFSVFSDALAHRLNMNAINDILSVMVANKMLLQQAGVGALIITLLLSPFLSGAIVTAARAPAPLSMDKLIHGAISEYWRMFRMLLWACVPLGVAGGIGAAAMHWAGSYADRAILQSSAELAGNTALVLMTVLLVIADATVDAGRAQFVNSICRRSAIKAWWSGFMMVIKRPLSSLGYDVLLSFVGLTVAGIAGLLRVNLEHIYTPGFILGLILTQLIVASIAFMKSARIFALAAASK